MKRIAVIVTLDTKSAEAAYLKELISKRGHQVFLVDIGYGGEPGLEADISAAEVARAGGAAIENLRQSRQRDEAARVMIKGAVARLGALCRSGQVEGIISIGGMSSAVMASAITREMPYRIPKLIFTSVRVLLWLSPGELKEMAPVYAKKLNKAAGPTKFLIPTRGWISIETEGSEFFDPEAVRTFIAELKRNLKPGIEIREVDANIDDPVFAQAVVAAFREALKEKGAQSFGASGPELVKVVVEPVE